MSLKQVLADLSDLPDDLLKAALQAILEIAQLLKGIAQVYVRVETGTLRDTGRVERGGETKRWAQVYVRFGGYLTNPKTGKICDYAVHVEKNYPYLKPAWDEVESQVNGIIRHYCLEVIQRVESHGVLSFS